MPEAKSVQPQVGEKPYEFCWRLHYEDGSIISQYEPNGFINLFAHQDQTGLKGVSVFRHEKFEPEQLVPGKGAKRFPTPVYVPCQPPIDIRYVAREYHINGGKKDQKTQYITTRKKIVVTTNWCKVIVSPKGFWPPEWSPAGDAYDIIVVPAGFREEA